MMIRNWLKRAENLFTKRALALCYHRIDDPVVDPWELAVSPKNFEEQLQVLKNYRMLPVEKLVEAQREHSLPSASVCLTFDDGYTDNFTIAKPLLEKYEASATFYIATGYTGEKALFWWDELALIFLQSETLPENLSLHIGKEKLEFSLTESTRIGPLQRQQHRTWVYTAPPPTQRCEQYLAIWEALRVRSSFEIAAAMAAIRQWAGFDPQTENRSFPMTSQQVCSIAKHSLFAIGIHTVSHCDLSAQSETVQREEIAVCKETLEKEYGVNATTITYPHGKQNNTTLGIAHELNLKAGFTTRCESITYQSNPYCLGRMVVKNWNGEEFEKQLRSWIAN